jgi:hypothetical protein
MRGSRSVLSRACIIRLAVHIVAATPARKITGRKRHIAVDTDGRLLMVNLAPADISDSAGAQAILDGIRKRWPWVKHLFADAN